MANSIPHTLNWFEIPVTDISRATAFYEKVFNVSLKAEENQGQKMAVFPSSDDNSQLMTVHGALVQGKGYTPSKEGVMIYLNGGKDLSVPLDKVEIAGGKVTMQKTSIGEHGFSAFFEDTEGNRLAMHSPE